MVIHKLYRASTVQFQFCARLSPSLDSTCPAMRIVLQARGMGRGACIHLLMQYLLLGGPAAEVWGWVRERQHSAAPCGYRGSCLVSVHWANWRGCHWGGMLLSQHQVFWVFVLLVSKISPDGKAKSFFSSCRNLQPLACSLSLSFYVASCTILGGIRQQQRTLPMISQHSWFSNLIPQGTFKGKETHKWNEGIKIH